MEQLGIDFIGFAAQVINFLLLLWLLKKFLYGPVLHILNERKHKIEKSLQDVKNIEDRLRKVEDTIQQKMNEANSQATEIISEAKKSSSEIQKAAQVKAEEQAQHLIAKADERLQSKEQQLIKNVEDKISNLAITMAQKLLTNLDENTKAELTKGALKQAIEKIKP